MELIQEDIIRQDRVPQVIAAAVVITARDIEAVSETLGEETVYVLDEIIAEIRYSYTQDLKSGDLGDAKYGELVDERDRGIEFMTLIRGYVMSSDTVDRLPESMVAEILEDQAGWLQIAVRQCAAMIATRAAIDEVDPVDVARRACLNLAKALSTAGSPKTGTESGSDSNM